MQSILDNPNLPGHLSEDEMNDIFDHHGWKVEDFDEVSSSMPGAPLETVPVQHEINEWPGFSSRGHPLLVGSHYHH